jgi:hypothetical protein
MFLLRMRALCTAWRQVWCLYMFDTVSILKEPGAARPGPPQLMMAFTGDGQLNPAILAARDERLGARP